MVWNISRRRSDCGVRTNNSIRLQAWDIHNLMPLVGNTSEHHAAVEFNRAMWEPQRIEIKGTLAQFDFQHNRRLCESSELHAFYRVSLERAGEATVSLTKKL